MLAVVYALVVTLDGRRLAVSLDAFGIVRLHFVHKEERKARTRKTLQNLITDCLLLGLCTHWLCVSALGRVIVRFGSYRYFPDMSIAYIVLSEADMTGSADTFTRRNSFTVLVHVVVLFLPFSLIYTSSLPLFFDTGKEVSVFSGSIMSYVPVKLN